MKFEEAKSKFIHTWGALGSDWGINRTMAQIHALLLISPEALSAEDIMEELKISRGNANMNIRALIDWGLVYKDHIPGERREYFKAIKDIMEIARKISAERRKRELTPILNTMNELKSIESEGSAQEDEFKKMTSEIASFSGKADSVLDMFIRSDKSWFLKLLTKL
ncbi:GbsR/MarR family transcriptional regulator [Marinigracilibium pacificum]|uniref:HTH-type transcriptional regulator n=1 Tax=Marinigracilibium pacificum TaxID=2729599 RepID=A0A848J2H0_9BACT|nr:MarR family transcriptional regulator [Marinigracilibium pacificum]NMM49976.1 transcriptional regulator [Marinigracilibium pacificum]